MEKQDEEFSRMIDYSSLLGPGFIKQNQLDLWIKDKKKGCTVYSFAAPRVMKLQSQN